MPAAVLGGRPGAGTGTEGRLGTYLGRIDLANIFPGADRLGPIEGTPPAAAAFKGDQRLGYVFLNADVVNSVGYSGKPINIVVGLNNKGVITGAKLVEHKEPIFLVGVPEKRVQDFIHGFVGVNMLAHTTTVAGPSAVDVVSGATVTTMVIDDSIRRAAVKIARSRGLAGAKQAAAGAVPAKTVNMSLTGTEDWNTLLADGSVGQLKMTIADINRAFAKSASKKAAARPEKGDPEATFINLYTAPVTIPVIGRSLLGKAENALLKKRLKPGQQAVLIAGAGRYSFKGSGYVRGGIFDRIRLIQNDSTIRFRDSNYRRLSEVAAKGAPKLHEIGLFIIPEGMAFDAAAPWRLQLLVERRIGPLKKAFITVALPYTPPEKYLVATAPAEAVAEVAEAPLWQRIWRNRMGDIAVLVVALGVLSAIFFFQDWLVRRPRLTRVVRYGFLTFTLLWIGGYAQAQLSVVNVLTFTGALVNDFSWNYFLMDPLIFILWASVAVSLLFWGRGAFCGWLCPFGAMQELLNRLGRLIRIPQIALPWGLNERLWPVKYIIFLGLFGLSLSSLALAEQMAEVEPFKTAIILRFAREWPFVLYAVGLLGIGLFVERFFCRYLCPLGAALAIPGRIRMFDWLRRYPQCGSPCQRCAKVCFVDAIHPDGRINVNECLYCLDCQVLYYDDHRCPVVIQKRLKQERRLALASKSMAPSVGRSRRAASVKQAEETKAAE